MGIVGALSDKRSGCAWLNEDGSRGSEAHHKGQETRKDSYNGPGLSAGSYHMLDQRYGLTRRRVVAER